MSTDIIATRWATLHSVSVLRMRLKNPRQQINYGTGGNVSDESIADAGEPLRIEWLPGSYIDFPVRR